MKISEWMNREVQSVKPRDPITHAREKIVEHRINQLPVLKNGQIVGIVTDRDLRDAFPSAFLAAWASTRPSRKKQTLDPKDVTVDMVMTPEVVTLEPDLPITTAAETMRRERIGAIPVVDGGKMVGIITRSDVLDAFVKMVGE